MKVTEPIDIYIADKLFQLTTSDLPPLAQRRGLPRGARRGGTHGGLRRQLRHRRRHRRAGRGGTAPTCTRFSRSSTGTHVRAARGHRAAIEQVLAATGQIDFVVNTAGVLPRGDLVETTEETVYSATEINYLAPIVHRAGVLPAPARRPAAACCSSPRAPTPAAAAATASTPRPRPRVVNLTQALADEWSGDGVRVNCINPERTGTPMRTQARSARSRRARCSTRPRSPAGRSTC